VKPRVHAAKGIKGVQSPCEHTSGGEEGVGLKRVVVIVGIDDPKGNDGLQGEESHSCHEGSKDLEGGVRKRKVSARGEERSDELKVLFLKRDRQSMLSLIHSSS